MITQNLFGNPLFNRADPLIESIWKQICTFFPHLGQKVSKSKPLKSPLQDVLIGSNDQVHSQALEIEATEQKRKIKRAKIAAIVVVILVVVLGIGAWLKFSDVQGELDHVLSLLQDARHQLINSTLSHSLTRCRFLCNSLFNIG
ncbi:MAG: hypothetical protein HQL77_18120 [Magnetococcales bacterium]|nr:hypothetical protein [Magnetococcales bacterium]